LILRKISTFDATRYQILRLKCTKFDFHWGSAADPAGGAYSAPTDTLDVFKGPASKGRAGEEGRGEQGWERKGRERKVEGKEGGRDGRRGANPQNILA